MTCSTHVESLEEEQRLGVGVASHVPLLGSAQVGCHCLSYGRVTLQPDQQGASGVRSSALRGKVPCARCADTGSWLQALQLASPPPHLQSIVDQAQQMGRAQRAAGQLVGENKRLQGMAWGT